MPYYKLGVQVEKNAVYFKLQSKVGLVVMWNGEDAVMVNDSSFRIRSEKKKIKTRKCPDFSFYIPYFVG